MQQRINAEACGPALLKDEALTFHSALHAAARKPALAATTADAMPSPHAGPRAARSSARPRSAGQAAARAALAIGKKEEEGTRALLALHRSPSRPDPESPYACDAGTRSHGRCNAHYYPAAARLQRLPIRACVARLPGLSRRRCSSCQACMFPLQSRRPPASTQRAQQRQAHLRPPMVPEPWQNGHPPQARQLGRRQCRSCLPNMCLLPTAGIPAGEDAAAACTNS